MGSTNIFHHIRPKQSAIHPKKILAMNMYIQIYNQDIILFGIEDVDWYQFV